MSKIKIFFFAFAVFGLLGAPPAPAQAASKKEKARSWKLFQQAIARNDKRAVAKMIVFPFEASIVGEEFDFKIESEAEFLKNYDKIFTAARRKKIQIGKMTDTPGEDEFNFEMPETGGVQILTFRKSGGAFKLESTMAAG